MKSKLVLSLLTAILVLSLCGCSSGDNSGSVKHQKLQLVDNSEATITKEIEFMAFLHRFAEDPDFQMQHIKFPLGKLSYANIMTEDGDYYPDDFTSRYWSMSDGEYMRLEAPGYFEWKGDSMIVYDYNSSLLDEPCGEFGVSYTFKKIDGEWYVTQGDYYGSDVGIAECQASYVAGQNKEFMERHQEPYTPYVFDGIPGDYPEASDHLLDEEDLKGLDRRQLRLMRNEIMARHGYAFMSKDLADHFNALPWYSALFKNVEKSLTEIERDNIKFIKEHEK